MSPHHRGYCRKAATLQGLQALQQVAVSSPHPPILVSSLYNLGELSRDRQNLFTQESKGYCFSFLEGLLQLRTPQVYATSFHIKRFHLLRNCCSKQHQYVLNVRYQPLQYSVKAQGANMTPESIP